MAEEFFIDKTQNKAQQYESLLQQITALISAETDFIANLSNISAALKFGMQWWWVGFYLVKDNQLVLGPFQGPVACTRINFGKGVCGKAWQQKQTIIVGDVNTFEGHIACSTQSQSEIVVPGFKNGLVFLVLDVDSEHLNAFDNTDARYLQQLMALIENLAFH
ncbi:MAG: GAF domain-containing protein [Bacteroidia bacterium]|nr:GAF domain-containing protein [Bacteroidia bacterium]